ncbi:hypothetical protein CSC67_08560 [Pusillimonas caeni]|uniref:hypothetical protein n=1 Tax=Pusillimonas caeni TaxID=1348472 RepID=UPI000E59A2DE|nr:hypothetical protein [Pusillimonas caeni]TFL14194.1 hypothetical protein CSC67_08560 [Pusillimonas caeni]
MTCRYTNTDWLDVLYNSVRDTKGGLVDAARFLTERRGKSIHPETLRARLRREKGEAISVEMALLLSEWMEEKAGGAEYARDWLQALCASEGLHVDAVPPAPAGGWKCEAAALQSKFLDISMLIGQIAGVTSEAVADGAINQAEADKLVPLLRDARVILHRMERNALRAAKGE